MIKTEV